MVDLVIVYFIYFIYVSIIFNSCDEKILQKLLNLCGPFEDPSPAVIARRSLGTVKSDGPLSYKATSSYISFSKNSFLSWDIDIQLLSLLQVALIVPSLVLHFAILMSQ